MTWFKDSKPLPASTRYETDYNLASLFVVLKINQAQLNDVGNYLVLAENIAGKDQTFCKLFVRETPKVDETPLIDPDAFKFLEAPLNKQPDDSDDKKDRERFYPPRVIIPLSNVTINEGDFVRFACKIDGYPKPKMTWYKDSEPLPASNRFTTDYDMNTCIATLNINDSHPGDKGIYSCVGENEVGKDGTSAEAVVLNTSNIDDRPLIDPHAFFSLEKAPDSFGEPEKSEDPSKAKPPKFIIHLPEQVKLYDGEKAKLKCKVEGYPIPKVHY